MASLFDQMFFVAVYVLISTTTVSTSCPSECQCQQSMRCHHASLDSFPAINDTDVIDCVFTDSTLPEPLSDLPYFQARTLVIHNCGVEQIADDAFASMTLLNTLVITANRRLCNMSSTTFRGLSNLISLDLTGNSLSSLPAGLFHGLAALSNLTLSGNSIIFTHELFDNSTLRSLSCDNCSLKDIPTSAFIQLPHLVSLELNQNELTTLRDSAFQGLTSLRHLTLDSCTISSISKDAFLGLTNLAELRVGHNRLVTLDPRTFDGMPTLSVLMLSGNQWRCDCEVAWMRSNGTNGPVVTDLEHITCASPESLDKKRLAEVPSTELQCASPGHRTAIAVITVTLILLTAIVIVVIWCVYAGRRRRRRQRLQFHYGVLDEHV